MKINLTGFFFLLIIPFVLLGLAACDVDSPVPAESTATIPPGGILSTKNASGKPVSDLTFTPEGASSTPDAAPTLAPEEATSTPEPAPTLTPELELPQPKPSPTALLLRNVPIEGGDPDNKFFAELTYPDQQVFTENLWFRVYAHDPPESRVDGEGIESVDFTIQDSQGVVVHFRKEKMAGYCVFGGGEPDCVIWNFADHQYTWPDGGKILSGTYTLNVLVTSIDQTFMFSDTPFTIQVP